MATLNITEFGAQGKDGQNNVAPVMALPPLATQNVTISGTSAQSAAFNKSTAMIRVRSDVACAILVSANPTALTTSLALDANQAEYFAVPQGANYKIAGITI